MITSLRPIASPGTSLKALVKGFVLTKQTEGKSPRTVEFYGENLKRFLWYANKSEWPDDVRLIDEWHIREFLGYVANETNRWELNGNGSESSTKKASLTTVHHYFVTLSCLFSWIVTEGYSKANPTERVKVKKPNPPVIIPYSQEDIRDMLAVCDYDYEHNAKLLASRNRAILLVLLDTGVRLSELIGMKAEDLKGGNSNFKVRGKGNKERVVRIGKVAQKAVWRYLVYRQDTGNKALWLSEEGQPLRAGGVQELIYRIKKRAGINSSGSTHRFRHTFAINFLRVDKNVFNLQYLLGHSELEMVRRYTATLGMEDALKAHESASPADLLVLGKKA